MDRDRPVARLEPVTASSETDSDGRHARLVREGIARPGRAHCWRSLGKADEVLGRLGARSADCRRAGNEANADSRRQRSGDARVVGHGNGIRLGDLTGPGSAKAFRRLTQLAAAWHEIEAGEAVRETAVRFLRVHPLSSADSLQLAAALMAAEGFRQRSAWRHSMTA